MSVSVIMRSKDSGQVIDQALGALYSQSFRGFELLVMDAGSSDRTLDIVRGYPCRLVQSLVEGRVSGAVLNDAIAMSRGDLLVFQSADAVPLSPHALARLLVVFEDRRVVAAFGRQVPRPDAHTWVRREHAVSFPASGPAPERLPFSLPFAAMRRSAWKRRPFTTDVRGSEDLEWGTWARRSGLVIRYVPDAIVMRSHNQTLSEIHEQRFLEGEADAFIQRDEDSLFRLARRVLGSTLRDVVDHLATGDLRGLCAAPVRRAIYHHAYFKGHKRGEARLVLGGAGACGQAVLARDGGAVARDVR
jgi:rhamnosyltransferase